MLLQISVSGSYSSASPPTTKTLPFWSSGASELSELRIFLKLAVGCQVPVAGSYNSALLR